MQTLWQLIVLSSLTLGCSGLKLAWQQKDTTTATLSSAPALNVVLYGTNHYCQSSKWLGQINPTGRSECWKFISDNSGTNGCKIDSGFFIYADGVNGDKNCGCCYENTNENPIFLSGSQYGVNLYKATSASNTDLMHHELFYASHSCTSGKWLGTIPFSPSAHSECWNKVSDTSFGSASYHAGCNTNSGIFLYADNGGDRNCGCCSDGHPTYKGDDGYGVNVYRAGCVVTPANALSSDCTMGTSHGDNCTTACQTGYTPSHDSLACSAGVFTPATFTCLGGGRRRRHHQEDSPCRVRFTTMWFKCLR